jgi:hypothetical protein
MHIRGKPKEKQWDTTYESVMDEVTGFLHERIGRAMRAGVQREKIVLDPGLGFGKEAPQDLEVMHRFSELRSFGLPIQTLAPGSPVLSDAANERGPVLVDVLGSILQSMKIDIDAQRATSQPSELKPQLSVIETQERLDAPLRRLQATHGLSDEEAAHACAIATAFFIRDCASVLNVETAFGIAVYGFVEGTKTVPVRIAEPTPPTPSEKARPWYKLW